MVKRIEEYCFEHKCEIVDALKNIEALEISSIGKKRTQALSNLHHSLKQKPEEDVSVYSTAERIFRDTGLEDYFLQEDSKDKEKERSGKSSNSQIYCSFMTMLSDWDEGSGGSLPQFLEYVNLQTSPDNVDDSNSVKLMTTHSAKGLEFPIVFLVCAEEDTNPHKFAKETGDPEDIEEERRLFYVGMTRAQERLYVSFSKERTVYGKRSSKTPSRFLREMKDGGATLIDLVSEEESW
jgi:DNA helicase-2/ATP-dependent DNA helicase PcrA